MNFIEPELTQIEKYVILKMTDKQICRRINLGLNAHPKEWRFACTVAKSRNIYFIN